MKPSAAQDRRERSVSSTPPQDGSTCERPNTTMTCARDYLSLTKPRIVELLLVTTVPAMIAAASGWPGTRLIVTTVVGGALVSGSAHATNMVIDRDIDRLMRRTAHRPVPTGRIEPGRALMFAALLFAAGVGVLWPFAGAVAAGLTVAAWMWYVGVYTLWLKRRTVHNIVVGGAAGAAPPMIGWAAVTGHVAPPALVLFLVVVFWTPTHFWALAIGTGGDYARASVPMLPTVRGVRVAARHGLVYALVTVVASLALPLTGVGGGWYLIVASTLGGVFVGRSAALVREPEPEVAWSVFRTSNLYLALLFTAIAVTSLLAAP